MNEPLPSSRPRVYSVTSLTEALKSLLAGNFPDVRVQGEVSNALNARSGHWYFTLKDERAEISCVCFRQDAAYLRAKPQDGLSMVARGRISVYEKKGAYQLYVNALELLGTGALQEQFERLKARLSAEGLFDEGRKRPLPPLPRRIGIVTSQSGAVIADMLKVLERRHRGLHVRLFPVAVQGQGAAGQIAEGLRYFSERPWADVVIVGRGGGSLEDLWAFNEEIVARAIAASAVPVVSAVGHQTDYTIADFVADLRAPTPSAAAELVVPEAEAILQKLVDSEGRLARAMQARLARLKALVLESGLHRAARTVEHRVGQAGQSLDEALQRLHEAERKRLSVARSRLEKAERRLAGMDLRVSLARQSQRLGELTQRLFPAMRRVLERRSHSLDSLQVRLQGLSPVAILERGYAIVQDADGVVIRGAGQVEIGDPLAVRLHNGRLGVRVEDAEDETAGGAASETAS